MARRVRHKSLKGRGESPTGPCDRRITINGALENKTARQVASLHIARHGRAYSDGENINFALLCPPFRGFILKSEFELLESRTNCTR